ncbi:aspartate-semialdehyde dehydrogenase [Desulfurobacterium thermolithotrophum DSM 11699]|uniref:Aspartate-semialdehyde dehydrogenase n=1 Tax=Desulfurobacterium thermolithotrophum (strain DSM 11699 / BSA) TaxID=868864 RepID=F0S0D2_DESTD|nr:aspartate-semialdehyde dehydrogenase [Desulfurobacterium thermolithotrophum]ADY73811.1 aspartate-semialdehyde dehydrogenase [Desulfurobacterium thermolithotrophum DSM 11699]
MKGYRVAVVGATGAVGQEMIRVLEDRKFPVSEIKLLASARSAGKKLKFKGEEVVVEELKPESFEGIDMALFSAGGDRSKQFAPEAVKRGAIVIDNSSAFRMEPDVPLVVPQVNPEDVDWHKGIIANPNCSTIQMVVVLKPLYDISRIKRVVVSTYQAVSGAGAAAIEELKEQTKAVLEGREVPPPNKIPRQIAFNCVPHIDKFFSDGYTREEHKMINETKKIMHDDSIKVSPTCVRVPVFIGHSEAVNIEFEKPVSLEEAREALENAPGVKVMDDIENLVYPTPIDVAGKDDVLVGRIRKDETVENGINLWIVGDNLKKGAALNAVQIAEVLIERGLI